MWYIAFMKEGLKENGTKNLWYFTPSDSSLRTEGAKFTIKNNKFSVLIFFHAKFGKKFLLFWDPCPHFPRPFAIVLFACLSIFSACGLSLPDWSSLGLHM